EYVPGTNDILLQQLNRKQNVSTIYRANGQSGNASPVFKEEDEAWVDVYTPGSSDNSYAVDFRHTFHWLGGGKEFLWESEKDGWRHLYRIAADGKAETLVTPGDFDVMSVRHIDEKGGYVY